MTCGTKIPSVDNILKKIHLSTNIFNELNPTCYDSKNCGLVICFQTVYIEFC